jgi:hypothetical protein
MEARVFTQNGHRVLGKLENIDKPVIAAINGFALGGGCEIALACDIRILSENAKIGQPEVNLGIIPDQYQVCLKAGLLGFGIFRCAVYLEVNVEILNNTQETKTGLNFTTKKISPDGQEEIIKSNTLNLAPGQEETQTITFNETATGTWQLTSTLNDANTGEQKETTLLIGVTEPIVAMEVQTPEYAGDENFAGYSKYPY